MPPLFESQPWLLIPIIVCTVEIWKALKGIVADALSRRLKTA